MDLFFLLFQLAPALKFIFKLSYIPQESDFKELTPSQYASFYRKADEVDLKESKGKKLLAFLPDDVKVYNRLINIYGDDLLIIGEDEYRSFISASEYIDNCCGESDHELVTLTDKLGYMAKRLPDVFTDETPYAIHAKSKRNRRD